MSSTKLLDVVSALVTFLDTALTIPVLDGPWQSEASWPVWIVVGHDDDPDSNEAAAYRQDFTSMESESRIENGSDNCMVVAVSGGVDMALLRTSARDTAALVDAALRADPTLGGVVGRADYGTFGVLKQGADPDGISVLLTFTVDYQVAV